MNEGAQQNLRPNDGEGERQSPTELRRLGQAARSVFAKLFGEWDAPDNRPVAQVTEAQIAASCLGRKPLYFDPYGEAYSAVLAEGLRQIVSPGVEVHSNSDALFVFRPETVIPILDADRMFYGPGIFTAIAHVSPYSNGELLGYGARSYNPAGTMVYIHKVGDTSVIYTAFTTDPDRADDFALERLCEIADYIGEPLSYLIVTP